MQFSYILSSTLPHLDEHWHRQAFLGYSSYHKQPQGERICHSLTYRTLTWHSFFIHNTACEKVSHGWPIHSCHPLGRPPSPLSEFQWWDEYSVLISNLLPDQNHAYDALDQFKKLIQFRPHHETVHRTMDTLCPNAHCSICMITARVGKNGRFDFANYYEEQTLQHSLHL